MTSGIIPVLLSCSASGSRIGQDLTPSPPPKRSRYAGRSGIPLARPQVPLRFDLAASRTTILRVNCDQGHSARRWDVFFVCLKTEKPLWRTLDHMMTGSAKFR
jgi:hypothetical protein